MKITAKQRAKWLATKGNRISCVESLCNDLIIRKFYCAFSRKTSTEHIRLTANGAINRAIRMEAR